MYFRVARYPDYGQLSGAQLDDMVAQEPNPAKEDPRDFALWKSQKPHEDAAWDSPWGPGRPGWHIECSAMAEKHLGPEFEIHGGGLDLRFPHHENELAQSRSRGYPFAHIWLHNGMLELGDEKMSKSLGNVVTLRNVLDTWGREVLLLYHLSGHWRKPVDFTDAALESARTQLAGFREALAMPARAAGDWGRLRGGPRGRLQHACGAGIAARLGLERRARGARARSRPLRASSSTFEVPVELEQLRVRAGERAVGEGLGERRRRAGRARGCGLGGDRPSRRHGDLASTVTSAAELVYGRRAVREALRGRREVLEVLATERAARDGWERKPKIVPERALTELAGTRDHQGVVARVEPFRYADAYELAAGEPLLVALDQVTDPRNLGAVIRSAEGAGATGVIVPAHNSARVTPAVARSSAGAVEHLPVAVVPNLARYLNEVKGPRLWVYAADAAGTPMADAGLSGGLTLVFGAEGKGIRPLVRRACDAGVSIPLSGQVESLNVSVAAAVLLYEARRQRGGA